MILLHLLGGLPLTHTRAIALNHFNYLSHHIFPILAAAASDFSFTNTVGATALQNTTPTFLEQSTR